MKLSSTSSYKPNLQKYVTTYSCEIIDCFFEAEKCNIKIRKMSDQLVIRPPVVKVIQSFARHQGYSLATLHLGKKSDFFSSGQV